MPKLLLYIVIIFLLAIILSLGFSYAAGKFTNISLINKIDQTSVSALPQKAFVVQKIRSLNRLQTASQTIQREFDLNLDLGQLDVFGLKIDSKKTQKIQVAGEVFAGVDLSKLDDSRVILNANELTVNIPTPEILNTEIDYNQFKILDNSSTILYKLQDLGPDKSREMDQLLKQQAYAQSTKYLREGACQSKILDQANENARLQVVKLFQNTGLAVMINTTEGGNCE